MKFGPVRNQPCPSQEAKSAAKATAEADDGKGAVAGKGKGKKRAVDDLWAELNEEASSCRFESSVRLMTDGQSSIRRRAALHYGLMTCQWQEARAVQKKSLTK